MKKKRRSKGNALEHVGAVEGVDQGHAQFHARRARTLGWCVQDSGSEAGLYLRLIDSCITQLKAQGPFRTWNWSKEEEEKKVEAGGAANNEYVWVDLNQRRVKQR